MSIEVCPESGQSLSRLSLAKAENLMGGLLIPGTRDPESAIPVGPTREVMVREDLKRAYPVVEGIPILMVPESLVTPPIALRVDLTDRRYREAYLEADFYGREAKRLSETDSFEHQELRRSLEGKARRAKEDVFPIPKELWIDAVYDCVAQFEAYQFLSQMNEAVVLQLGGKGTNVLNFLVAGARQAWLITPVLEEAEFAISLARAVGLDSRLHCVVGVAEELPLASESMDRIYIGGSLHHMQPDLAAREINRVLVPGGRFAAVEPWRAPLYDLGTRILGKREANAYCYPLTADFLNAFAKHMHEVRVQHHGALTRYPLLAASKARLRASLSVSWRLQTWDDRITRRFPRLNKSGSSVAVLAEKTS